MATTKPRPATALRSSRFLQEFGWDLLLGSIAAFYAIMTPYTKVEESFNVQAMHDILYNHHHIEKYDHLEFPGVVPRSFVGALFVSTLAWPVIPLMTLLQLSKFYSLLVVRLLLGSIVLSTLHLFRVEVRRKFGYHVEGFFAMLTAVQFHLLFYSTRPLPNVFAFALVNLAYYFWFKGNPFALIRCLMFSTIVFRCDIILLSGAIGLELLLSKTISIWEAIKCCVVSALICIGITVLIDSLMWKRVLWPEFEVLWFNSVLNRSSEWGIQSFHWYFTSALPRSLLVAYPLCMVGMLLDRRISRYTLPVFSFILLYSKLPHKELRFIIASIPMFNVSAAITASRVYNNRKKHGWRWLYFMMTGSLLISLGCSFIMFLASYNNYPGGLALKALHQSGSLNSTKESWVHIDAFTAISGVSRFCEEGLPWKYSKDEGIALNEYRERNFTYLLNEHSYVDGYKCLFAVNGFSKAHLRAGFPPITLLQEPKVFVHGNTRDEDVSRLSWPGCQSDSINVMHFKLLSL